MKKSDRAKIFAPFSPLKGFYEALCEKERVIVPKAELCDEHIEEIDRVLHSIDCGDVVEAVFYNNGVYEKITACVSEINPLEKYITLVKRKIPFEDLHDLKKC